MTKYPDENAGTGQTAETAATGSGKGAWKAPGAANAAKMQRGAPQAPKTALEGRRAANRHTKSRKSPKPATAQVGRIKAELEPEPATTRKTHRRRRHQNISSPPASTRKTENAQRAQNC